ncbi:MULTISPECIES: FtsX-like permease family protein [unclassified Rathayibacter]|uniref:FtsX-like permease family protein n=1 Tax=unclassified Rathayibacter TaxID=2609250 RepID=UPI00188BD998|nr:MULTISPECIES: FtsX-like permease family protein [unclassified Rathayibacter]MBF4463286.1 hypothetical protein [Rathayibacter sp. VKM Ac-2879]MBF4504477.1 hypothetical protein [Rathayibacter sp. VKM Ac-2878]
MIRLLIADLRTNVATRLGPLVTIVATAVVLGLGVAFLDTAASNPLRMADTTTLASTGDTVLVSSLAAVALVLGPVLSLSGGLRREDYALWQLAGVAPGRVWWLANGQNAVLGLVGATVGALLAVPVVSAVLDTWVLEAIHMPRGSVRLSGGGVLVLIVVVSAAVVLVGLPAARSASRTSPLDLLRDSAPPEPRMTVVRWLTVGGLLLALAQILSGLATGEYAEILGMASLLGPVLAALVAALGPLVFPRLILGWTALVPARRSTVWYLARHSAQYRAVQSSAGILALLLSLSLLGALLAPPATATNWVAITHELDTDYFTAETSTAIANIILLLGGPLALSVLGIAVVVFIAGCERSRENALLRSAGSLGTTIVAASALEAVIIAVTAFLLGLAVVSALAVAVAVALGSTSGVVVPPAVPLLPLAGVAAAGAALIAVASVVPAALSMRRSVPASLSAE